MMSGQRLAEALTLAGLLTLAGFLALAFFVGVGAQESLAFSATSFEFLAIAKSGYANLLAGNSLQIGLSNVLSRVGDGAFSASIQAFIFQFFGITEKAIAWPGIILYVANAALLYLLVRQRRDNRTAFVTALIWLVSPPFLTFVTQGLATSLSVALLFVYLWTEKRERRNPFWLSAILVVLLVENIWLGFALLFYQVSKLSSKLAAWRILLLVIPLAIALLDVGAARRGGEQLLELLRADGFSHLLVFGLLAFTSRIWDKENEGKTEHWPATELVILVVFPSLLLSDDITLPFQILVFLTAYEIGRYMRPFFGSENFPRTAFSTLLIVGLAGALASVAITRSVPFPGSGQHIILYILGILGGITFLLVLASLVARIRLKGRWRTLYGVALLLSFATALLGSTVQVVYDQFHANRSVRQFHHFISSQSLKGSLAIVEAGPVRDLLNFYEHSDSTLFPNMELIDRAEIFDIETDLLLSWNEDLNMLPPGWSFVSSFGLPGKYQLNLYQEKADSVQDASSCSHLDSPTIQGRRNGERIQYIPVDLKELEACIPGLPLEGGLTQLSENVAPEAYLVPRWLEEDGQQILLIGQLHKSFLDPSVFSLPVEIEGGAVYLYSIEVRSKEPISLLHWGAQYTEGAFGGGIFPEWQRFSVLLWSQEDSENQLLYLSPLIFDHYGDVEIRDFVFQKLDQISEGPY